MQRGCKKLHLVRKLIKRGKKLKLGKKPDTFYDAVNFVKLLIYREKKKAEDLITAFFNFNFTTSLHKAAFFVAQKRHIYKSISL